MGLGGRLGGQHQGPGAVVDAAGVAGGHGAVLLEGGLELGEALGGGIRLDVLVAVEERVALLARQGDGEHLAVEGARSLGGGGLPLALEGEGVLGLPGDAVLGGHILGGDAHVRVAVATPEAVLDHAVDELGVPHAGAPAGGGQQVGCVGHALRAAGHHQVRVAHGDGLGAQGDGLEA